VYSPQHEVFIDQIRPTSAAIAEEVKDTMEFVLPGGVHEDFIEALRLGEGGKGDDRKLVLLRPSGTDIDLDSIGTRL
jgi:hypothetical protein